MTHLHDQTSINISDIIQYTSLSHHANANINEKVNNSIVPFGLSLPL